MFKVRGEFSLKIYLEPVDGFHLMSDSYIVRTSQRCDNILVTFHLIFKVKEFNVKVPCQHVKLAILGKMITAGKVHVGVTSVFVKKH